MTDDASLRSHKSSEEAESAGEYARARGFMPAAPDPTRLTTDAVNQAVEVSRREITSLRGIMETRLDGMDQNSAQLWARLRELPEVREVAMGHLRDEIIALAAHNREVLTQRLDDLDKASKIAAERIERIPSQNAVDAKALASDVRDSMRSEREYIMGQISLAMSETHRVQSVTEEKFAAIDGLFNSNDKALTAALAAQVNAAAEQQKSNALAIDKSEKATQETIRVNAAQTQTGIQGLADTFADLKERVVRIESLGVGAQQQSTEHRLSQGAVVSMIIAGVASIGLIITIVTLILKKLCLTIAAMGTRAHICQLRQTRPFSPLMRSTRLLR